MFGLVIRHAFECQLHTIALAPCIGPESARAAGLAHHSPRIFDGVTQAVAHYRVFPVDQGGQLVVLPQQIAGVSLIRWLEHEAQPGVVAFVLEASDPPASAAKPYALCLAETDPGSGRDRRVWPGSGLTPHPRGRGSCAPFKPLAASCSAYSENL